MKKNLPAMLLIAASAALAVISFILLPQTVIVQFSTGGSGVTTMPKLFAIALPLALGAGGAAFGLAAKGDEKMKQKCLIVSLVGIAVFVIMLVVNL